MAGMVRVEGISDFTVAHVESLLFAQKSLPFGQRVSVMGTYKGGFRGAGFGGYIVCFIRNGKNLSKISVAKNNTFEWEIDQFLPWQLQSLIKIPFRWIWCKEKPQRSNLISYGLDRDPAPPLLPTAPQPYPYSPSKPNKLCLALQSRNPRDRGPIAI